MLQQNKSHLDPIPTMRDVESCYKKVITQIHQCHELNNSLFSLLISPSSKPAKSTDPVSTTTAQSGQSEEVTSAKPDGPVDTGSVMRSLKELLVTLQQGLVELASTSERVMGLEARGDVEVVAEIVGNCQETVKWFEDLFSSEG